MIFFRYLGLILANKAKIPKQTQFLLLKSYLTLKALNLLPQPTKKKIKQITFLKHPLSFFDLQTTTSLIESIFIDNEYFFVSDNSKPVIMDLGSNLGLSIIYLKQLYPKSSIQAFEPDISTFKMLVKNITSYKLKGVTAHNVAVTGANGSINFYIDKNGAGSPLMSTSPLRINNKKTIKAKSIKLSKKINGKVDFIKMDIEGSESQVLEDLDKSQKLKLVRQISIEYHHHINIDNDYLSKFLRILEKNNFGYQIHAGQNTPFRLKTFEDIQIHAYNKKP